MTTPHLLAIFCALLLLSSCKKDDEERCDSSPTEGHQQYGTPFTGIPEVEDMVFYEVNIRAFGEDGDLTDVLYRLDEIEALGVNVIWLMPVQPDGEVDAVNSPYAIQDYLEVGEEYGNRTLLRLLIEEAHERNMAVILDWVANHSAWDNPWIENADWYTQDEDGNIIHPEGTNWEDVADLNYENEDMRAAMIDAMRYWVLEVNADGYRFDAADYVPLDFWDEALANLNGIPNRDLILLQEGGNDFYLTAGFQLNYGWTFYNTLKDVYDGTVTSQLFTAHNSEYGGLIPGKHKLRFTTNHDESAWDETPIELFGGSQGATGASIITTYLGGIPLIYGSQEVGREENLSFFSNDPIDWSDNPEMLADYKQLMEIYTTNPALRKGDLIEYEHWSLCAFKRQHEENEVVTLVNVRANSSSFDFPEALIGTTWTNAFTGEVYEIPGAKVFNPYEFMVLTN